MSNYLNTAAEQPTAPLPQADYHIDTPASQYDLNYVFPVKVLESEGVRLEPFIPSEHAKSAWEVFKTEAGQRMYRYMPFHGAKSFTGFLTELEARRRMPTWVNFAIIDKTRPEGKNFAGMVGLINSSLVNVLCEVGGVHVFPDFQVSRADFCAEAMAKCWTILQRTHVNTHVNGLLLRYAFEELKLRRVQWRANTLNEPSVTAAKRLGFDLEGILYWDVCLPAGKEGHSLENNEGLGRPEAGPGRHSAQLSINWERWRDGVKAHIDQLMAREITKRT